MVGMVVWLGKEVVGRFCVRGFLGVWLWGRVEVNGRGGEEEEKDVCERGVGV